MLNWPMIMICGLFLLCSNEIILILYGNQWSEAAIYLFILAFMIPFVPNWTTITALWKATGHVKKIVLVTFIEKLLFFLSLAALFYSIKLYAVLLVASYVIANTIKAIMNVKIIGVSIWKQYREWLLSVIIMAVAVVVLSMLTFQSDIVALLVKSSAFLVAYYLLGNLLKLRGMTSIREELMRLVKRK